MSVKLDCRRFWEGWRNERSSDVTVCALVGHILQGNVHVKVLLISTAFHDSNISTALNSNQGNF